MEQKISHRPRLSCLFAYCTIQAKNTKNFLPANCLLFPAELRFFSQKSDCYIWKIRKFAESIFPGKKCVHTSKKHLYKNWRAENMLAESAVSLNSFSLMPNIRSASTTDGGGSTHLIRCQQAKDKWKCGEHEQYLRKII